MAANDNVQHDLIGFNRIAIHFPCVGSWMAPGAGFMNRRSSG